MKNILLFVFAIALISCAEEKKENAGNTSITVDQAALFAAVPSSQSNVNFHNTVTETIEYNFLNYLYMYNGGGVAIGDINNDGLEDIFFTANQVSNKLYLNKGGMVFEDITISAGVADVRGWKNGVTMVDINNDGYLDIYVCKGGPFKDPFRKNRLFVNQGDNTFKEESALYGLEDIGYSTQAYFFDYDKDNDLDMYLVNHRVDFQYTKVFDPVKERSWDEKLTDKFYENNNGKFQDVTKQLKIKNRSWGLSAAIYDFDDDGLEDIYVANDFLQGDNLWINNKSSFKDESYKHLDHISQFSMGSDVADINNDGMLDLFVLDMVSEDHVTSKINMGTMNTEQFNVLRKYDQHYQYMSNMLFLNRGDGIYSEVSNICQVDKTDWSWAPLIADFNNDGNKEIFITNGVKRDVTNNDGKKNLEVKSQGGALSLDEAKNLIPSRTIPNRIYTHNGDCKFSDMASSWGLSQAINSNGSAYGDLDNDGDLDLVLNNIDMRASIYENKSQNNSIVIELIGPDKNKRGLGTVLRLVEENRIQTLEKRASRGFLSSVGDKLHFGIGSNTSAKRLEIVWPDGKIQNIENPKAGSTIKVNYANSSSATSAPKESKTLFSQSKLDVNFKHQENEFNDFAKEILLPHKFSSLGPSLAKSDVNGDGLEDVYIGGASNQAGSIFVQSSNGVMKKMNVPDFVKDQKHEDTGALFFDLEGDGDQDLLVVSGGNEYASADERYLDRLYVNNGQSFERDKGALSEARISAKAICASDFDSDGDIDVFIGGRIVPGKYPLPAASRILQNNQGKLVDITEEILPELKSFGLVTDALFSDYDGDGDQDLLLVGEWLGLTVFENTDAGFTKKNLEDFSGVGWFFDIAEGDIDNDGDMDYVLGNLGLNNKFGAKEDKPFHVFCSDFDNSGTLDIVLSKESKEGKYLPLRGKQCSSEQMPFIESKFPTFHSFAHADLNAILGQENLENSTHYSANNFASMVLINNGNGQFDSKELPMLAQYGPLLSSHLVDVNNDGQLDIVGAGSIFNAEVETKRYDASKGFVLLNDGKGNFQELPNSGLKITGNAKATEFVNLGGTNYLFVAQNDGPLDFYKLNNSK